MCVEQQVTKAKTKTRGGGASWGHPIGEVAAVPAWTPGCPMPVSLSNATMMGLHFHPHQETPLDDSSNICLHEEAVSSLNEAPTQEETVFGFLREGSWPFASNAHL